MAERSPSGSQLRAVSPIPTRTPSPGPPPKRSLPAPGQPRPTTPPAITIATHADTEKAKENDPPMYDVDLLAEELIAEDAARTYMPPKLDLKGWRLVVVMTCIFIGLFLSFLDTSIVAVALATIASKFNSFENSSWVFTAYLLTYMASGIILARLSDFLGLKTVEVLCMVIFLVFSAACAVATNMTQLIIFRAFQGIGGSGLFSMCTIIALAAVPPRMIGSMATYVSLTQAVAVVLGPVLGGVIAQDTESDNWRWIFYLNLPLCAVALIGLLVAWPKRTRGQDERPYRMSFKALESIDFIGAGLLLISSVMLIFSLQQAGSHVFAWDSGVVIESFIISGVCFLAFLGWEAWVEQKPDWALKPILPIRVAATRVMGSAIIVTILNGFLWYLIILNLPDRFQLVGGDDPTTAGLRLLPMVISAALGTFATGALSRARNLTAHTTILASAIQVLAYGLMTTLSLNGDKRDTRNGYGFEILLGFGFGMSIASTTILTILRFLPQPQHLAVMQGCITQMRSLGGSIVLSISTIIFNHFIRNSVILESSLSAAELQALYKSPIAIEKMDAEQRGEVVHVYAQAFRTQMQVATCVAAVALVVSFGCLERSPPPPGGKDERRASVASVHYG